jgi:DNA-binding MarR family transcriptional regulator
MMEIDIQAVMGCTCLKLRKASRHITQIYDYSLSPSALTVNQFGLLAWIYGAKLAGRPGLAIGALGERLGTDPTTLNRTLKPLIDKSLVKLVADPADARVRMVSITEKGRKTLAAAMPLWHEAQTKVESSLGADTRRALNGLLDQAAGT